MIIKSKQHYLMPQVPKRVEFWQQKLLNNVPSISSKYPCQFSCRYCVKPKVILEKIWCPKVTLERDKYKNIFHPISIVYCLLIKKLQSQNLSWMSFTVLAFWIVHNIFLQSHRDTTNCATLRQKRQWVLWWYLHNQSHESLQFTHLKLYMEPIDQH